MTDPPPTPAGTLAAEVGPAARSPLAWARPALLAAGLIGAGWALRSLPGVLDPAQLERAGAHGVGGASLFVFAAAASCAVGLPRQAAAFAGGYAFGAAGGSLLALLAQVAGAVVDFCWARIVARPWARRRMRGRLARLEAFLTAHPFRAVLILRLLPVGNNLALNLLAGASEIPLPPFLLASALGFVPQTLVFALLGGGVRVSHGQQIGLGVALFVVSALLGVMLLRARSSAA